MKQHDRSKFQYVLALWQGPSLLTLALDLNLNIIVTDSIPLDGGPGLWLASQPQATRSMQVNVVCCIVKLGFLKT